MPPEATFGPSTPAKNTTNVTGIVTSVASAAEELDERPDAQQRAARERESEVGAQFVAEAAAERGQQQRREAAEGGEGRDLDVADHLIGDRRTARSPRSSS